MDTSPSLSRQKETCFSPSKSPLCKLSAREEYERGKTMKTSCIRGSSISQVYLTAAWQTVLLGYYSLKEMQKVHGRKFSPRHVFSCIHCRLCITSTSSLCEHNRHRVNGSARHSNGQCPRWFQADWGISAPQKTAVDETCGQVQINNKVVLTESQICPYHLRSNRVVARFILLEGSSRQLLSLGIALIQGTVQRP